MPSLSPRTARCAVALAITGVPEGRSQSLDTPGSVISSQSSEGGASSLPDDCPAAVATIGVPLALLIPFGIAPQLRFPAIDNVRSEIDARIAEQNSNLQRGLGLENQQIAAQIRSINELFAGIDPQIGQTIGGVAIAVAGISAIAYLVNSCAPTPPAPTTPALPAPETTTATATTTATETVTAPREPSSTPTVTTTATVTATDTTTATATTTETTTVTSHETCAPVTSTATTTVQEPVPVTSTATTTVTVPASTTATVTRTTTEPAPAPGTTTETATTTVTTTATETSTATQTVTTTATEVVCPPVLQKLADTTGLQVEPVVTPMLDPAYDYFTVVQPSASDPYEWVNEAGKWGVDINSTLNFTDGGPMHGAVAYTAKLVPAPGETQARFMLMLPKMSFDQGSETFLSVDSQLAAELTSALEAFRQEPVPHENGIFLPKIRAVYDFDGIGGVVGTSIPHCRVAFDTPCDPAIAKLAQRTDLQIQRVTVENGEIVDTIITTQNPEGADPHQWINEVADLGGTIGVSPFFRSNVDGESVFFEGDEIQLPFLVSEDGSAYFTVPLLYVVDGRAATSSIRTRDQQVVDAINAQLDAFLQDKPQDFQDQFRSQLAINFYPLNSFSGMIGTRTPDCIEYYKAVPSGS